jgi:hypothetical protein
MAVLLPTCLAAEKGVVEGYVRDSGNPLKGVQIAVWTGESPLGPNVLVVPIITKSTVGVVAAKLPDTPELTKLDNAHVTHTDSKGYYKLSAPANSYYIHAVETVSRRPVRTRKLKGTVVIAAGKTLSQDFDFSGIPASTGATKERMPK